MKKMAKRFTALCCAAALVVSCGISASAASYSGTIAGVNWSASLTRGVLSVSASTSTSSGPSTGDTKTVSASCKYYAYGVAALQTWSDYSSCTYESGTVRVSKDFESHLVERTISATSSHRVVISNGSGSGSESKNLSA